jgi:hypothetical protein
MRGSVDPDWGRCNRRVVVARRSGDMSPGLGRAGFGFGVIKWRGGISTDDFLGYSYFSLAIGPDGNVELASSRGFSTDNTHIWDAVCRIATAKI